MVSKNVYHLKLFILTVGFFFLLLPSELEALKNGGVLMVEVSHSPAGDYQNIKIEDILNRSAVMVLEQAGLKGVVLKGVPEESNPELKISCRYLQQQDMLKLEYQLQETITGKRIAEIQISASVSHFLDRTVGSAVQELLHKGQDEINRIVLAMQESEPASVSEPVVEPEQMRKRFSAEVKVSGVYMLGHSFEHLPYGLLIEGRFSYPMVQSRNIAWQLGVSLGMVRFLSAVDYKASYMKTLLPLCLLTELRLKTRNDWIFRLWMAAGAAVRPPHENDVVNALLAPAFPYTNMGIGFHLPLSARGLGLSAGLSGMGILHLYEDSATGKVQIETLLGVNIDLGMVWRI
jgi:hypothetical protein